MNKLVEENKVDNGMVVQSSSIISTNKFNILDGLVEEGEIIFT